MHPTKKQIVQTSDQLFLEIQQKCEIVTQIQARITESQSNLKAVQEDLIKYQQEEEELRINIASKISESALEQLRIALGLQSQLRSPQFLWTFKKEVEKLLDLSETENQAVVFTNTAQQKLFLDIKNRLNWRGLFVREKLLDNNNAKVWSIEFKEKISGKNLAGSRINSQLLATDCENGWKLTWMLDQPRLIWCPQLPREPVFNRLTEYDLFETIKNTLALSEIIVENLLCNKSEWCDIVRRSEVQHYWSLKWNTQFAILLCHSDYGRRWDVVPFDKVIFGIADATLTGIWENFDLYEYLKENGIDVARDDWYN